MISKKYILSAILVLATVGTGLYIYKENSPKIDYSLEVVEENAENGEEPLDIIISSDSVAFTVTFEYGVGEIDTENIQFWTTRDGYIIVKINYSPDKEDSEEIVERHLYKLAGIITGLKSGEWRMRVEEPNARLLDEVRFVIETGDDLK